MSEPKEYVKGDVIALRSGGPHMTVKYVDQTNDYRGITTSWFAGGKFFSKTFQEHELILIKDHSEFE